MPVLREKKRGMSKAKRINRFNVVVAHEHATGNYEYMFTNIHKDWMPCTDVSALWISESGMRDWLVRPIEKLPSYDRAV